MSLGLFIKTVKVVMNNIQKGTLSVKMEEKGTNKIKASTKTTLETTVMLYKTLLVQNS